MGCILAHMSDARGPRVLAQPRGSGLFLPPRVGLGAELTGWRRRPSRPGLSVMEGACGGHHEDEGGAPWLFSGSGRGGAHRTASAAAGLLMAALGCSGRRGQRFSTHEAQGECPAAGGEEKLEGGETMEEGTGFTVGNRGGGKKFNSGQLRVAWRTWWAQEAWGHEREPTWCLDEGWGAARRAVADEFTGNNGDGRIFPLEKKGKRGVAPRLLWWRGDQ
jgi:hypothetical protein